MSVTDVPDLCAELEPGPCPDCEQDYGCDLHLSRSHGCDERTFDGVEYGVRWDNGDVAWWGPNRERVEHQLDDGSGVLRSPLTAGVGALLWRRVYVGPAHAARSSAEHQKLRRALPERG